MRGGSDLNIKRITRKKRRIKMSLVNREQTLGKMTGVSNIRGQNIEKYIPRKCSATSRILGPGDRSSIQITVPTVSLPPPPFETDSVR